MSEAVAVNTAGESAPVDEAPVTGAEGVAAEGTDAQAVSESVDPVKAKAADEDPEIELDKDLRVRRSELVKGIKRRKELDRAAFDKFQEAAKIRQQMESLRESDPEEYFKLRGVDPLDFAVKRLERELQMREATPEQRRAMDLEQQLQQERSQRTELEQKQQRAEFETKRDQYIQKLDKELPAAIQKHGLHTDPLVYSLVAQQIRAQVVNGVPEDYEAAAESVSDLYRQSFKKHTATLKFEDAVKEYPEFVKLIREGDLARARAPLTVRNTEQSKAPAAPNTPKPQRKWAMDDWASLGVQTK